MNITLRQLRLFTTIARCGSLTSAADELAITQSAASQSIKELERQLGYPLLRKVGRKLMLTEAGQQSLPRIRQALVQLESLQHPEDEFVGGVLRVCASETIGSYLMPKLLADFIAKYPKVETELQIQNTDRVIQQIEQGYVSVGFIEGPAHNNRVQITPWCQDELVVFAQSKTEWVKKGVISKAELPTLPWIVREPGSGTRAVFDQAFKLTKQIPYIKLALTRQEAIKQSALVGLGVGCLSKLAVEDEIKSKKLVVLSTRLNLERTFSIVEVKGEIHTNLSNSFIQFAKEWITKQPQCRS